MEGGKTTRTEGQGAGAADDEALRQAKRARIAAWKEAKQAPKDDDEEDDEEGAEDADGVGTGYVVQGVSIETYKRMKAEFEEKHFYFVPMNTFVEVTPDGLKHYTYLHAKEYLNVSWGFEGGEDYENFMGRVDFLDIWRRDPQRRCIHKVDFKPSDDPTVFYMPFVFQFQKDTTLVLTEEGTAKHLDMFDTLVRVASGGDDTLKEYLLNFFAHMLQRPLDNPGVAIILTGQKGVGKDTLLDFFRLHVIGPAFSHNYTSTRQFFDKHDIDRKDKIMLKMEDSDSALCKQYAKDLRARITARENTINPKGKDAITYPNYARHFFSANQAIPVGINDDNDPERRFVIMAVLSELKGNSTFWCSIYNEEVGLFTPAAGLAVANMLLARDISQYNPRVQPANGYQEELYEVERTPEQRFLEDGWKAGVEYTSQAAFQAFQTFCSDNGFPKWTETAIGFGQKMTHFVRDKKLNKRTGRKKQVYYCKAHKQGAGAGGADTGETISDDEEEGAGAAGNLVRAKAPQQDMYDTRRFTAHTR